MIDGTLSPAFLLFNFTFYFLFYGAITSFTKAFSPRSYQRYG